MNNYVHEQTLDSGIKVIVDYDDTDGLHPRKDFDQFATVSIIDRCRYSFGDNQLSYDELQKIASSSDHISLPIYMYDHSGITINTTGFSCPWDSGQVGVIHVSKADARMNFSVSRITKRVRQKVLDALRSEIKELDDYLTGQVYYYKVLDQDGEELDSCYGFIGESEYCLKEGLSAAEFFSNQQGATNERVS